jgi:hypothetical protein
VQEALDYAAQGDAAAVELLLTYHAAEAQGGLAPFWLDILDQLPETTPPKRYAKLLPAMDADERLVPLAQKKWLEGEDYVHSSFVRTLWLAAQEPATTDRPQPAPITPGRLSEWYCERARAMDERAGQLYAGLELLREGVRNGIGNLETLMQSFSELADIIQRGAVSIDTSVSTYEKMAPDRRLECFLGDCDEATLATTLLKKAKALLQANPALLEEFLCSKAVDEIELVNSVFLYNAQKETKGDLINQGIFRSETALILTALECMYSCLRTDADAWASMWKIFESLPVRKQTRSEVEYCKAHMLLDQLEFHLTAGEDIQTNYTISNDVAFFADDDVMSTLASLRSGDWASNFSRTTAAMQTTFNFQDLPASVELQILGDAGLHDAVGRVRLVCCRWRARGNRIRRVHQLLRNIPRAVPLISVLKPNEGLGLRCIRDIQFLCHHNFRFVPQDVWLLYCFEGLLVQGYCQTARQLIDGTLTDSDGLRLPVLLRGDSEAQGLLARRLGRIAIDAARELINNSGEHSAGAKACLHVLDPLQSMFDASVVEELEQVSTVSPALLRGGHTK